MSISAYLFEAKSIQTYLLATNRLKEVVGGSELVEKLDSRLLDDVLESLGAKNEIFFSRRGGGAFFAFGQTRGQVERLADLWPLVVRQFAPDLEFVHGRGRGMTELEAFKEAHVRLLADRNRQVARLPQAGPFVRRNRRTGEPASFSARKKGTEPEPVDAATRRKLDFSGAGDLACRFAPKYQADAWPLNLTPDERKIDIEEEAPSRGDRDFPFPDERRLIAVVHADGNGLGQLLMDLKKQVEEKPERFVPVFSQFSKAIAHATEQSAQKATVEVLGPAMMNGIFPARPIVLGGDDLTIIVRADLALSFAKRFLEMFANESKSALGGIAKEHGISGLPRRLTACAGIAYGKASQPFHMLYGLAEELCGHAKNRAKARRNGQQAEVPTALSFHRIATAMIDDYRGILDRELTLGDLRQTLECYFLDADQGRPTLDNLLALRNMLADPQMARGPARELLGLIGRDPDQAKRRYARWREVMGDRHTRLLDEFDERFSALGTPEKDLPFFAAEHGLRCSPLGDVNALISVGSQ